MTSATLYREGPDLDTLLAELDDEYDGQVRVVDVNYARDGGVMGFFARRTIGVHYTVDTDGPADTDAPVDDLGGSPLEAMLRAAEMIESGRAPEGVPAADDDRGDNVEFARMLLEMATQKAAARAAVETPFEAAHRLEPAAPGAEPFAPELSWTPAAAPAVVAPPVAALTVAAPPVAVPPVAVPPVAASDFAASRAELLERVRSRPIGAHRASDADETPAPAPVPAPVAVSPAPAPVPVVPVVPVPTLAVPVPVPVPVAPAPVAPTPVAPTPVAPAPVAPAPVAPAPPVAAAPAPASPTRTPLTLRRQLSEIGVPLSWIPDDSASAFAVIEQLVRQVPLADPADLGPGQILVVAGPATQAHAEAVRLCARLRLDPGAIRTAGCGADPIRHRRQAAALELEVRGTRTDPCVVVVATDSSADLGGAADLAWAAEIVAALAPEHLLLVVDATCRVTDARTTVAAFGSVSAIAIVSAARTASPAALWELGLPVASLDGRAATRGAWAALLIDRVSALDGV